MIKKIVYLYLMFPVLLCAGAKKSEVKEMKDNVALKVKEPVILVHGLIRTKVSMMLLGSFLKTNGYDVNYYSYYSTRHTIDCHSAKFAEFLAKFAKKHPGKRINIVTHSMGGIITRSALADLECRISNNESKTAEGEKDKINFGRIVMLAPPNKGSMAATVFGSGWLIPKFIKPLPELRNTQKARIKSIPLIKDIEFGVISGRYDAKVRPEEAALKGEKEHLTVNSAHTFIMNRKHVKQAVLNFLKTGSFKKCLIYE